MVPTLKVKLALDPVTHKMGSVSESREKKTDSLIRNNKKKLDPDRVPIPGFGKIRIRHPTKGIAPEQLC